MGSKIRFKPIPIDLARERLRYNADTGAFYWRHDGFRRKAYARADKPYLRGYRRLEIDGRTYFAHRVAWAFVHGEQPDGEIDHIDGNRANNALSNLRVVTHSRNQQNQKRPQSSHGHWGASQLPSGRWRAQIKVDGVLRSLGTFDTPQEATTAYIEAKTRLHAGWTMPLQPVLR